MKWHQNQQNMISHKIANFHTIYESFGMLLEMNFGRFQKLKNCHFDHFSYYEMRFWGTFHIWNCQKFPNIQNSELLKWSKWLFLGFQNDQNWFHIKFQWQKNLESSTLWYLLNSTCSESLIRAISFSVQCVSSRIFLLLRFYVKSILVILKVPKLQFLQF